MRVWLAPSDAFCSCVLRAENKGLLSSVCVRMEAIKVNAKPTRAKSIDRDMETRCTVIYRYMTGLSDNTALKIHKKGKY